MYIWKTILSVLLGLLLLILFGCSKDYKDPVRVSSSIYPKAPTNLVAKVGDRYVRLNWEGRASQIEIRTFYIFRRDSLTAQLRLLDSTSVTEYLDASVRNGIEYSYQISARSEAGYEGPLSDEIKVTPGVFAVSINQGETDTKTRTVTLYIVAPDGTRYIKISNDSTFSSGVWEALVSTRSWDLSAGDGQKKVYVTFRDDQGNETQETAFDTINLDSQATIFAVQENSGGIAMKAGDIVRIILNAGEALGKASFDIGQLVLGVPLYDDATHGDEILNDGVYSLDYTIPSSLDVNKAIITGHFEDALGNVAATVSADGRVTIINPPVASRMFPPASIGNRYEALYLSWTANTDTDFLRYKLFRGNTAEVDTASYLISIITTSATAALVDSNLQENTSYFYRIYVYDTQGLASGSNVVEGKTLFNLPPQAVTLETPINPASHSMFLSWGKSSEYDFASYRLFRSESADVTTSNHQVALITSRSTTTYLDEDLDANTTYWYRLYVYDAGGLKTASNLVSAATLADLPPQPVIMADPVAVQTNVLRLTWSGNADDDFASYRIFRSKTTNVDPTSAPIVIINNRATTTYDDMALTSDTRYYYRVFVFDGYGLSAGSNLVTGLTLP
jgi:fibronectin type 3 domain-containing protein